MMVKWRRTSQQLYWGAAFAAWSDPDPPSSPDLATLADAIPAHIPAMLRLAIALVGSEAAEDVMQESLTRAWQALGSLRKSDALQSWLLRITANACRTWLRDTHSKQRHLTEPLSEEDSFLLGTLDHDPGASHHAAVLDLRAAINTLDHDQRTVVLLRYYAQLDATEIGHVLEVPSGTVRTRLYRALHVLRERLGDMDTVTTSHQKGVEDHESPSR